MYSVQIVIVLYKCTLSNSISFRLLEKLLKNRNGCVDYDLLIYNNDETQIISHTTYDVVNASENKMLVGAYNFALNKAVSTQKDWLLLVDQDTEIPKEYFDELEDFLINTNESEIVSIVPFLTSHNRIISPEITNEFIWKQSSVLNSGVYKGRISAFNSMSCLNVSFLTKIGGFNEQYPLDMLDHWMYRQISKVGKSVYVLEVKINHNLSLLDKEHFMPLSRYKCFLLAEKMFVKSELTFCHYTSYKLRLIFRTLHQLLRFNNKKYSLETIKSFVGL